MKTRVMVVFGTRPEAIKMGPVIRELLSRSDVFETLVCSAGQHNELLVDTLISLGIKADYSLEAMQSADSLCSLASFLIGRFETVFNQTKPDIVLVHGDTTSAMAASVAAFYLGIEVGHVEAGLRSGDMTAPFPEEFNRKVIAQSANFNFVPTEESKLNLLNENCAIGSIFVTGNTVIDSLHWIVGEINQSVTLLNQLSMSLEAILGFNICDEDVVLITGHRRENFGGPFEEICLSILDLARLYPSVYFVYPVHLNPHIKRRADEMLSGVPNILLIAPLNYCEFVFLLMHCRLVLTDSGGLQEEGPALGKNVLVMRNVTERPEMLKTGLITMVGSSHKNITAIAGEFLAIIDYETRELWDIKSSPIGDGNAAKKIVDILVSKRRPSVES